MSDTIVGKIEQLTTHRAISMYEFNAMVQLAVFEEREACAKIADSFVWYDYENCSPDEGGIVVARLIRERSNNLK